MGFYEDAKRAAQEALDEAARAEPRRNTEVIRHNQLAMAEIRAWFGESGIEIPHMKASGWEKLTSEGTGYRSDLTWSIEGYEYKGHYHDDPMNNTATLGASIKVDDSWYGLGHDELQKPWRSKKPRPNVKLAIGRVLLAQGQ